MPSDVLVPELFQGVRLDIFLVKFFCFSRTYAQELIAADRVLVNGRCEKKRYCVSPSDRIVVSDFETRPPLTVQAIDMSFDVLFEDESLFVINKPPGLVVHPAPGNYEGTFVNGFLARCTHSDLTDPIRPGVVHRLDKDTSGVLIAAKTQKAVQNLSLQFHDRTVKKEYILIVRGVLVQPVIAEGCIGRDPRVRQRMAVLQHGRSAYTEFVPIVSQSGHTLVKAFPRTGRTHQIRVHAAHMGHPVLGDTLYGKAEEERGIFRHMLHCRSMQCVHPTTYDTLTLQAPLPVDMLTVIQKLGLFA